jgi:hypothetical protein
MNASNAPERTVFDALMKSPPCSPTLPVQRALHAIAGSTQTPVENTNWHFVRFASVHIASFVHWREQTLVAVAPGVMHVVQLRPGSHGWPHAFENVLQLPAWQLTPAVPPNETSDPSSVCGRPAAQPQAG